MTKDGIMCIGAIFAGGVGSRMRSKDKPKQFLEVHGKPIIVHTLEHFENCAEIDAVTVACVKEWIPHFETLIKKYGLKKIKEITEGGASGQMSIYNALCAAERVAGGKKAVALVHDGVRPIISPELLSRNIECVISRGSCITAGVVKETIVVVGDDGEVLTVPDRAHSRVAKAPQSFWLDDILAVQRKAIAEGVTDAIDCCTLCKSYGRKLVMIDGPYENVKITTPDDYFTMRAMLDAKENEQIYGL